MQLEGHEQLVAKLNHLPLKLQRKHTRAALNKAARRLVRAAKDRVPKRTGALKKSLGFRLRTYKSNVLAIVGPRSGFRTEVDGKPYDPIKVAHLVEMGHGGPRPAPAHPFLRPAFDATVKSNLALIAEELRKGIEQEAK